MKKTLCRRSLAFAALVVAWAGFAPAHADEFRVRAVSAVPGFPQDEVFVHDPEVRTQGKLVNVKAFLNHEADVINTRSRTLVFTNKASAESVKDEAALFGRVELGATRKSGIFVFLPSADDKVPGRMIEVDDGKAHFPAGSVLVVNRSALPLRILLAEEEFDFKADETRVIDKFPQVTGAGAPMKASVERDGSWVQVSSGLWPAPGTKRVLQVAYKNATTGRVEIRGIRDVMSVE